MHLRPLRRPTTVLAASGGGHFDMLAAIAPAIIGEREWLTVDGPRGRAIQSSGEVVHYVPTFDLDHFNLHNPVRSARLAFRLRPSTIVTTGAGVVFTFTFFCWMLGADVIFVETMARVSTPSKTGAVLARIADLHIVQWPELADRFPRAKLCRPALLPDRVTLKQTGAGCFVSLGTHSAPFQRLLELVDAALADGILPGPCFVQGATTAPLASMEFGATLTPSKFRERIRDARYVIGHAGAGFVSTALSEGRRPIVLARLSSKHEHVDDHQLELTRKLANLGLVVNAETGLTSESIADAEAPLAYDDIFPGLPTAMDLIAAHLREAVSSPKIPL